MPTSLLLPKPDDNDEYDNRKDLKAKKEKVIKPLSDDTKANVVKPTAPEIPGANEDLLEELRIKTAELASKVSGDKKPEERILKIEDDKDSKDLLEEINSVAKTSDTPKEKSKPSGTPSKSKSIVDPAVRLIREKLAKIYRKEPDTSEEAIEAYQAGKARSVHQQYMYDLTTSGKSLADIQTEWHNYYIGLPDAQKHEVWKEFYDNQRQTSHYGAIHKQSAEPIQPTDLETQKKPKLKRKSKKKKSVGEVKTQILNKVSADGKLKPIHHLKSLLFGIGLAGVVGLIITFTFFNEVFIAPFISPSQSVSATPIIGAQNEPVGPESKIIIPKINLEVPVVFDLNSIKEKDIQNALEDGVVHYASTPKPGEIGNSVIVGHSSNNILNSGKYKFAFVLLKRLETEDIFYVNYDGVRYTYKIYQKKVVSPDNVEVLQTQDRANTITLITCDPPGTSINRLIITAEQISPRHKRK